MNREIGKVEIERHFFKNRWVVFTGKEENIERAVSFDDFENAYIFSEIIKLRQELKEFTLGDK